MYGILFVPKMLKEKKYLKVAIHKLINLFGDSPQRCGRIWEEGWGGDDDNSQLSDTLGKLESWVSNCTRNRDTISSLKE